MQFIQQLLTESYRNLFSPSEKQRWAEQVWDILQQSYQSVGGLKGDGFNSMQDMINNIPMWKINTEDEQVKSVVMYKDKGGRKLVAVGTDGSQEGKKRLKDAMKNEFSRSYSEVSGPLLAFIKRNFPELYQRYKIPVEQAEEILGKKLEPVNDYMYKREIGGDRVEKELIGTPGIKITPKR